MSKRKITSKKIKRSLVVIILLILFLFSLTFSLSSEKTYKINLNDGLPVVDIYNKTISPGTVIERTFFVENSSSSQFDYKLYFENVDGVLGNVINATFYDGDEVILSGYMNEINKSKTNDATGSLKPHEKKYLKVVFTFPMEMSDEYKDTTLLFDLKAVAVWPS